MVSKAVAAMRRVEAARRGVRPSKPSAPTPSRNGDGKSTPSKKEPMSVEEQRARAKFARAHGGRYPEQVYASATGKKVTGRISVEEAKAVVAGDIRYRETLRRTGSPTAARTLARRELKIKEIREKTYGVSMPWLGERLKEGKYELGEEQVRRLLPPDVKDEEKVVKEIMSYQETIKAQRALARKRFLGTATKEEIGMGYPMVIREREEKIEAAYEAQKAPLIMKLEHFVSPIQYETIGIGGMMRRRAEEDLIPSVEAREERAREIITAIEEPIPITPTPTPKQELVFGAVDIGMVRGAVVKGKELLLKTPIKYGKPVIGYGLLGLKKGVTPVMKGLEWGVEKFLSEEEFIKAALKIEKEEAEMRKRLYVSPGWERIEKAAAVLTQPSAYETGVYTPIEERGLIGKYAGKTMRMYLAGGVVLAHEAPYWFRKTIITGEALFRPKYRPTVTEELFGRAPREAALVYTQPETYIGAAIGALPLAGTLYVGKGIPFTQKRMAYLAMKKAGKIKPPPLKWEAKYKPRTFKYVQKGTIKILKAKKVKEIVGGYTPTKFELTVGERVVVIGRGATRQAEAILTQMKEVYPKPGMGQVYWLKLKGRFKGYEITRTTMPGEKTIVRLMYKEKLLKTYRPTRVEPILKLTEQTEVAKLPEIIRSMEEYRFERVVTLKKGGIVSTKIKPKYKPFGFQKTVIKEVLEVGTIKPRGTLVYKTVVDIKTGKITFGFEMVSAKFKPTKYHFIKEIPKVKPLIISKEEGMLVVKRPAISKVLQTIGMKETGYIEYIKMPTWTERLAQRHIKGIKFMIKWKKAEFKFKKPVEVEVPKPSILIKYKAPPKLKIYDYFITPTKPRLVTPLIVPIIKPEVITKVKPKAIVKPILKPISVLKPMLKPEVIPIIKPKLELKPMIKPIVVPISIAIPKTITVPKAITKGIPYGVPTPIPFEIPVPEPIPKVPPPFLLFPRLRLPKRRKRKPQLAPRFPGYAPSIIAHEFGIRAPKGAKIRKRLLTGLEIRPL